MNFQDLLTRWNNGIQRGSASKFAKRVGYSKVSVAEWARGVRTPGEEACVKVAKVLGTSVPALRDALGQSASVGGATYVRDRSSEQITRQEFDELRRVIEGQARELARLERLLGKGKVDRVAGRKE